MESMNDSHFQLRLNGPSDVKDLNHVSKVWFGYKDTWIAETDHSFYWDLKGYYGDLERILDDDHCRGRDNIVVSKELIDLTMEARGKLLTSFFIPLGTCSQHRKWD